jgi:hypothetical protein
VLSVSISQSYLFAAAARPDCDEPTLVELGRISEEARDFSQSLPIFVRHLSYPRTTMATMGDAEWNPLEGRAALSLVSVIGSLSLLMEEHAESRPVLASAASDLWLWLGYWTSASLSHLSDTPHKIGRLTFAQTFTGVLELSIRPELIVQEAVDVIVTLFCLGTRSREFCSWVDDIMRTVQPEHSDMHGLFHCIMRLSRPRPGWNEGPVWEKLQTRSKEVITHTCYHLDSLALHDAHNQVSDRTTRCVTFLLSTVTQVIMHSEASLSSLSQSIQISILTHVLDLCERVRRLSTGIELQDDMITMACLILRAVFSAQLSTLSTATLVSHALDKNLLTFLTEVVPPESSHGKHSGTAKNIVFLLEDAISARMFLPEVYVHLRRHVLAGGQSAPNASELISRWSSDFDAVSAQLADQRGMGCAHSQVSDLLASMVLVLTKPVSAQGFSTTRSLLFGLHGQQVLQSCLSARRMAWR